MIKQTIRFGLTNNFIAMKFRLKKSGLIMEAHEPIMLKVIYRMLERHGWEYELIKE
jgi:hypothetical protein